MANDLAERIYQLQKVAISATTNNVEHVYAEALNALRAILNVEVASLQLLDETGSSLRFVATLIPEELPRLQAFDPLPVDERSISGAVVKGGDAILLTDSWEHPVFGERQRSIASEKQVGNRSYICVPLKVRSKILGTLNILHRDPNMFLEEDKALAIALASFISVVLNRIQFEVKLSEVATTVSSLEMEQIYTKSMEAIRTLLDVEVASLQLLDETRSSLRFVATLIPEELPRLQALGPLPVDERSISGAVVKGGDAILLTDSWEHPVFGERQRSIASEKQVGNRSYICVPLKIKDKVIGVINILHHYPDKFSKIDLQLSLIIASFIAITIQNTEQTIKLLENRQKEENLERALIMADVANNFVHKINNDLGFVQASIGRLESLKKAGKLSDNVLWEKLINIKEVTTQTIDLVQDFKNFDKISNKGEFINVKRCIDNALQDLENQYKNIYDVVSLNLENDTLLVYATQDLTKIFWNLIRNSWDALQDSSHQKIFIAVEKNLGTRDYVTISVTDTGPGLPQVIKENLFQLGATTKLKGIGFGLWWVKLWLRRYGGDIRYDETYNNGAKFLIKLPLASSAFEEIIN